MFDLIAPVYGPAMRLAGVTHQAAVERLRVGPGGLVIDVGGGTGVGAATARRLHGCRVLVADRSKAMLRRAKPVSGVALVLADALRLPVPDESADGVLITDALHHFAAPLAALREAARALKPCARLVVEELDAGHIAIRALGRLEGLLHEPGILWRPDQLVALVRAAGLEVEEVNLEGATMIVAARRPNRIEG